MRSLRLVAFLAAFGLAVFAWGCDDDSSEDETATTTTTTTAAEATRTRTTSPHDAGGQRLASGPGSPTVASGRTAADGETVAGTPAGGAAAAGVSSSDGIFRPFATDSPWNTPVTDDPVDRRSDRWIEEAQIRRGVVEEEGQEPRVEPRRITAGLYINTRSWTVPVVDSSGGVRTRVVCRQLSPYCGDGARVAELDIPPDAQPGPGYDGWLTVVDREERLAYDLWRARRAGDVISYQFMRRWHLDGPGFQEPDSVSARGSGLPLFAGLITPEEIRAGRIEHALAISLPGPAQRNYVQPASSTDGVGRLVSIPEGARVRLKRSVTFESLRRRRDARCEDPAYGVVFLEDGEIDRSRREDLCETYRYPQRTNERATRAIIAALKRYGAIVVDRARVPTLYAQQNVDWSAPLRGDDGRLLGADNEPLTEEEREATGFIATPLLRGNEVEGLRVSDFDVVQIRGEVLKFPSLETVETRRTVVARSTPTTTGGAR